MVPSVQLVALSLHSLATLNPCCWCLLCYCVCQLEVRDVLRNDVCFKGRVGNTVNNALHVAQHSNGEAAVAGCGGDMCVWATQPHVQLQGFLQ